MNVREGKESVAECMWMPWMYKAGDLGEGKSHRRERCANRKFV